MAIEDLQPPTEDEPIEELYDFLYRDSNRLISYYSQIFQGKLTSFEEVETETDTKDRELKSDVKVVSYGGKTGAAKQSSAKRTFDPHDMNNADVLTFLSDSGFISEDCANAVNGSLFLVKGKIFFVDIQLLKSTSSIYSLMVGNGMIEREEQALMGVEVLNNMIGDVLFPPIYFLETEDGEIISGFVKESGMEEPANTYYFRYGQKSLSDVYLLGLKEVPEPLAPNPAMGFLQAMQTLTSMLANLLFPEAVIRATPLVMYRKFGV